MNKFLFGLLVLVSNFGVAQTVNTGDLYVAPGTIVSTIGELSNTAEGILVNDGDLLLYSHYNNDGLVAYTPGISDGMTRLLGSGKSQVLSGSKTMDLNNVVFDNDIIKSAFHLKNEIKIYGNAYFEKGIMEVDANNGAIVFEDDARHFNAGNLSYVQGEVRNVGDDIFEFPVGAEGYYRSVGVSAPDHKTDIFKVKYILENPDLLYSHSNKAEGIVAICDKEYWTISKVVGNSGVMLSLTWNEQTTSDAILEAPHDEISIVRWDVDQNKWVDKEGVVESTSKMVSVVLDPLQAHGVFALARVKDTKKEDSGIVIYNAVSPNDDGMNEYFKIDGLEAFETNKVAIYNRYGVKVYETTNYDTTGNVFKGISEGQGIVLDRNKKLPDGTYFYTIRADNKDGKNFKKAGYLYINK